MIQKPNYIHPLIGPHEGRELELMLKGEKPAAMFYDVEPYTDGLIPEKDFQPYVEIGKLIKKESQHIFRGMHVKHIYYSLPNYVSHIERLIELAKYQYDPTRISTLPEELERETGKLLGYSDEAIEYYLEHRRNRKKV